MSLESPGWLVLLVALPVLWLLHRRMRGPLVLRVSSVLPFHGATGDSAAARPRRQLDVTLLLLLAAAGSLALAAAGPVVGAGAGGVYVVLDTSASMDARLPDGRSVLDDALARARGLVGGADAVVRPLRDPAARPAGLDDAIPPRSGADGLPGSLAAHLELARAGGFPGLLLVTDRELDAPGVVVVGPSAAAGPNFGIADVLLDGDEMVVSVRSTAAGPTDVTVRGGTRQLVVRVPAHGVGRARFPDAETGGVVLEVEDALRTDDSVAVERIGGAGTARLTGEPPFDRIRRALSACGLRVVDSATSADVLVRRGGPARIASESPMLHFAAEPGPARAGIRVAMTGSAVVPGTAISGRGDLGILPSPAASVAATGRVEGGNPGLLDAAGPLAVSVDGAVITCLDPEDPASTWHEEPSFAVFVAAALEHLVGRERLVVSGGAPASEIEVARAAVPLPAAERVQALRRRGGGNGVALGPWLALVAALCTLGAVLSRRPRSFPVPSWGPDRAR